MTNEARQKSLDRQKWIESEQQGFDMSGCMLYCEKCDRADHSHATENGKCYAAQQEREKNCLCAKAYNRLVRVKNEKH